MRLASFLVIWSLSAALGASARAQTDAPPAAPAGAYDEQAVGVRNLGGVRRELPSSGERPDWMYTEGKWDAFRGPDHHPISQAAFYRIVGREDLLRRYQHKAAIKTTVTLSSGALLLGGLVFAAIADLLERSPQNLDPIACPSSGCGASGRSGVSPGWGLAIAGAGLVGLIVGHHLDPTPVDAGEADALARDYDQLLKSRLGISETASRE